MQTQWYTLSYDTPTRGRITLRNLQQAGIATIQQAQTHLGSTNFLQTAQPHHYCQAELDMFSPRRIGA